MFETTNQMGKYWGYHRIARGHITIFFVTWSSLHLRHDNEASATKSWEFNDQKVGFMW
jgi:hypothetical protein